MSQNLTLSPSATAPQQPTDKPLVSYAPGVAKVDFMTGNTVRTVQFLKDLVAELRESGFPEATLHVAKHDNSGHIRQTEFVLSPSEGHIMSIAQFVGAADMEDDYLTVAGEKANSLWPLHIYGYRLGLITACALSAVNPPLAAAAAGALLAVPSYRMAFGSSKVAAFKDFLDSTFSLRVPFCNTRHAILQEIAVRLIEAANEGPHATPVVLEPTRKTWALREIVSTLQKAGLEAQIHLPQKQIAPQPPEPQSLDDVAQAFNAVEQKLKLKNAGKLSARFMAAAQSIADSAASVKEPELKKALLAFHETFTSGQAALIQSGDRPIRRAEQVAQTLATYVSPDTTDTARQSLSRDFTEALETARKNMEEEIQKYSAAGISPLQDAIAKLRNDHI